MVRVVRVDLDLTTGHMVRVVRMDLGRTPGHRVARPSRKEDLDRTANQISTARANQISTTRRDSAGRVGTALAERPSRRAAIGSQVGASSDVIFHRCR